MKASEHLLYEAEMMRDLVPEIARLEDGVLRNAVIEAFLIHARLLAEFLGWNRGRTDGGDDIRAEHFLSARRSPRAPPVITHMREPINKRVAHLSYLREHAVIDGNSWDFSAIASALQKELILFAGLVDRAHLSMHWIKWLHRHEEPGEFSGAGGCGIQPDVKGATGAAGPGFPPRT